MVTMKTPQITYPSHKLKWGHAFGNQHAFVTLDGKSDVLYDPGTVKQGLRESTNQRYYLLRWEVSLVGPAGAPWISQDTTFTPAYQRTILVSDHQAVDKTFFLPFENFWLRSAHFLLNACGSNGAWTVRSTVLFPKGTSLRSESYKGHTYLAALHSDGTLAILWGTGGLSSLEIDPDHSLGVQVVVEFPWAAGPDRPEFGLSFTYLPGSPQLQLNSIFDIHDPTTPSSESHLARLHLLLAGAQAAMRRYLSTCRLVTPDPLLNQAVDWAKVNQLKDQQEYRWGSGFSNNPPSDTVVGRDSVWYLSGSAYFAQAWSRKLFDFWFKVGLGLDGKFTEFFSACSDPLQANDYDLNVNDNTPLFLIAAHQYYSLTGDRDFLNQVYPRLLQSADFLIAQREAGENNQFRLVWCTATETFIRGLCGWRNCIRDYTLSGAVTEVNVECVAALRLTAELARESGDSRNAARLEMEASDLTAAIQAHLRSSDPRNPFYLLNIDPSGRPIAEMTADVLFPALYGVSDEATSGAILTELFSERFWVENERGGGGIRTVSAADPGYHPAADPATYGLMGGVWPNLALWAARAAALHGLPDLALKALRATSLLTERSDPARANVVPGELPEYFNGDDLVQRGQPRSTFLFGIFVWAATESFLGISPHPAGLKVAPLLPQGWAWAAISNLPYRGFPLSMLAVAGENTLYTTTRVDSPWNQVIVPIELQVKYDFKSEGEVFWLVVPAERGSELLACAPEAASGWLYERSTGRLVAEVAIPEKGLVRYKFG